MMHVEGNCVNCKHPPLTPEELELLKPKPTVVYHWWDDANDPQPYANLRAPILMSIATLRAVNSTIPITVLDMSTREHDWKHFPEKLNFSVEKEVCYYHSDRDKVKGWRLLSRIPDLHEWADFNAGEYIYCDSDIFWLRDPLPLGADVFRKFCFDRYNTGYYYTHWAGGASFVRAFENYVFTAIHDLEFRKILQKHALYESWCEIWDEMVLTYMQTKHPDMFATIPNYEHVTMRSIKNIDLQKMRMLHCNGLMVKNPITNHEHARGIVPLMIWEFYTLIQNLLGNDDLALMYSEKELEFFKDRRISIKELASKLKPDATGHFHLKELY